MWIQIDDSIAEHDKIYNLADTLNIPNAHAVGLMTCLWCWAIKTTPDGEVTNFPARALAKAAGWEKKPEQFFDAICSEKSLFIERCSDGRLFFRNWEIRAEMLIDAVNRKREQTKTRVERYRERKNKDGSVTKPKSNENVTHYTNVTEGKCNANVTQECNAEKANVTPLPEPVPEPVPEPYNTLSPTAPSPEVGNGSERAREKTEKAEKANKVSEKPNVIMQWFSEFWEIYPKKQAVGEAEEAWLRLNPTAEVHTQILETLRKAVSCDEWQKENGRFIPHPAKWLEQKRWKDEITPAIQQHTPIYEPTKEAQKNELTPEEMAEFERLEAELSETPEQKRIREWREKNGS